MKQCGGVLSCGGTGRGRNFAKEDAISEGLGTIVDAKGFNAEEDCLTLQECFDEPSDKKSQEKILSIISFRSNKQRLQLKVCVVVDSLSSFMSLNFKLSYRLPNYHNISPVNIASSGEP